MVHKKGYIALTTVLVIGAVLLAITIVLGITSVSQLQTSLSTLKNSETLNAVESCTEESLNFYRNTNDIPVSIELPGVSCSVTIESQDASNIVFVVSEVNDTYYKSVRINASKTDHVYINSWEEIE